MEHQLESAQSHQHHCQHQLGANEPTAAQSTGHKDALEFLQGESLFQSLHDTKPFSNCQTSKLVKDKDKSAGSSSWNTLEDCGSFIFNMHNINCCVLL
jgi:hypothetical protein